MIKLLKWWNFQFKQEVVKQVNSKENGWIRVVKVFDKPRLMIGGMIQSGGVVRKIWSKALKKIKKEGRKVEKVLIVGLGCGDCAFEVQKQYSKAKMIGVEIDKHVVDIAECYFNLATVKNLKIVIDKGQDYVKKLAGRKRRERFDLIIVDVYLGRRIPRAFTEKKLYELMKKILDKKGVLVINHLFFGKHKKQAKVFISKLDKVFKKISLQKTGSNLLIFASN